MLTYLFKQNGKYYYRRRVPFDIAPSIRKAEIKIPLGIGCSVREAKSAVVCINFVIENQFSRLRMTDNDLEEENKRLKKQIAEMRINRRTTYQKTPAEKRMITLDLSSDMPLPKSLGGGLEVPIEQHRVNLEQVSNEWAKETLQAYQQTSNGSTAGAQKLLTLFEFLPNFYKERSKKWTGESSKNRMETTINLFLLIVGDKSLSDYERTDMVRYTDVMEQVHNSYGRSAKDKERSLQEILTISLEKEKRSITTLENHFNAIKSIFQKANQYYKSVINLDHLYGGIEFSADAKEAEKRIPWAVSELNTLFQTPVWAGCANKNQSTRYEKGDSIYKDSTWWLPVIALFTGMRLEEICQLQVGDLKVEDDIQYLDVVQGKGKRLKTKNSMREVPIHQTLIDLGFLELFTGNVDDARIFPNLVRSGADDKLGNEYSGDFSKYRTKTDTYKRWRDFHSFRHTYISQLALQCNTNMIVVRSLVGHGDESITEGYTHVDMATKALAIQSFQYEGLDIGHLFK